MTHSITLRLKNGQVTDFSFSGARAEAAAVPGRARRRRRGKRRGRKAEVASGYSGVSNGPVEAVETSRPDFSVFKNRLKRLNKRSRKVSKKK